MTPFQHSLFSSFETHKNRGLFADHYLNSPERLRALDEWRQAAAVEEVFSRIAQLYSKRAARFGKHTNEAQTESDFIRPVLDVLWGHECYKVQVNIPNVDVRRQPDYAFFRSEGDRESAEPRLGTFDYWRDVPCLGDAKKWTASLDKERGYDENPSAQICNYLYRSRVRWGILTNGEVWRLYEREKSSAGGIYYEVNLEEFIKSGDLESFKYFYLFFRREAFLPDAGGSSFIEKVFKGSVDYATEVGDRLKESVYDALRLLMNGFLKYPANGLDVNDPSAVKLVEENSLILLYRFLFILYAEDRNLLPCDEEHYRTYCLQELHRHINQNLRGHPAYMAQTTGLWLHVLNLFSLIDTGFADAGIPAYNGGLFSASKYPHIAHVPQQGQTRWDIGDLYLSEAIDLLSYQRERWNEAGTQHIDYSTLEVQHLGSIYEGLLELQPHIAEEALIETLEDGKSVFRPARNIPTPRLVHGQPPRTVASGEVFLVTNRGERKATGSYYTPKHIVDYIVENAVGPLTRVAAQKVSDMRQTVEAEIKALERSRQKELKFAASPIEKETIIHKYDSLVEEQKHRFLVPYLSTRILDPAMGSGHFLVGTADFLSLAMATDPNLPPLVRIGDEEPQVFYKRLVVEHCLYGVDLNPLAVELAKLSLWLHTVSKHKALSFLDHHMRCGNSLIGARIEQHLMMEPPSFSKGHRLKGTGDTLPGLYEFLHDRHLRSFLYILEKISDTPTQDAQTEKLKETLYESLEKERRKFRAVANCWLAPYFGVAISSDQYAQAIKALRGGHGDWQTLANEVWFEKAQAVGCEKRFFHWELEYPEVFFDADGFKPEEMRGFDAVIGNPPYDVISEKEQGKDVECEKLFFSSFSVFREAAGSKLNLYRLFISLAVRLLRYGGANGFIVPVALLGDSQARPLRELLLKQFSVKLIEAFPQKDNPQDRVFTDAKLSTCLYILRKEEPGTFDIRVHPGRYLLPSSPTVTVTAGDIQTFDPDNFSIPCYPNMTLADFQLAKRLAASNSGRRLGSWAPSQQGEVNLTTHSEFLSDEPGGQLVLRGSNVGRYLFNDEPKQGEPKYLLVEEFLGAHGPNTKAVDHLCTRIGYQRGAAIDNWRRIIATIIEVGNFCSDTINYIVNPKQYDLFAVLALLNSSLWEWRFRLTSTNNHVNAYEIDAMPFPNISFLTPTDMRDQLVFQAKQTYEQCMHRLSPAPIIEFVQSRLSAAPAQEDVVHDLLAYLAEHMIEMNKQKQAEIRSFLTWLEREIGTGIDELSNKTRIRAYHDGDTDALIGILRQNRQKLNINPDSRAFSEILEREMKQSIEKLSPLKKRIAVTDRLIDVIVYRLYGLTEQEIAIVEGKHEDK
jgi:Alw26I/Eco31I/Esp3I family type II restriction m6 adenine DNA methyltransferase